MSVTNITNERNVSNNGSDLDVFGNDQTIDIVNNTVNERVELEERLSENLINNGDFEVEEGWNVSTNWNLGSGVATGTEAGTSLTQTFDVVIGATYKITYEVKNYVSGQVKCQFLGGSITNGPWSSANGVYVNYLTAASGNNRFGIKGKDSSRFNGDVDNIKVQQVSFDREAFTNETDQHNSTVTNIVNERTV